MQPTHLSFDKGSILVRSEAKVPYSTWDDRIRGFRAQALYYKEIVEFLKKSELSAVKDSVEALPPCPDLRCRRITMRAYQKRALDSWDQAGRRGVIVLPTGAGKTVIAMKAIELVNRPTIIIVPTLDLLEQWRRRIEEELSLEVGVYGGGDSSVKAVTVSTYDSAYLRAGELGNMFSLLIFDECLPYDTEILLGDGHRAKIGSIVNGRKPVSVLSYNAAADRWESRRVTDWIRRPVTGKILRVKFTQRLSSVTCTENHEFARVGSQLSLLSSQDMITWTPAKKLRVGDHVIVKPRNQGRWRIPACLGPQQTELLFGTLLGDGFLQYSDRMARLTLVHGVRQNDYLKHKMKMLDSLFLSQPRWSRTQFSDRGVLRTASACSVELADRVPKSDVDLVANLTPLGLAYWYMDDGSIAKSSARIHSQGRDIETVKQMAELLRERLGLDCHALLTAQGPIIELGKEGTRRLCRLIESRVIPQMQYKLLPEHRGKFEEWTPDPRAYGISRVEDIIPCKLWGTKSHAKDFVYCIDVEENKNFVAGNTLVHNCHHLPADSFRQIAEMFTAPNRMGLTATYEREDMLHAELPRLIGGVVYRLNSEDLAGRFLSNYKIEKLTVELTEEEKAEYERDYQIFTDYLERNRIWLRSPRDFQRFIMRTARDPQARQALLARNSAVRTAFNSQAKIDTLEKILHSNPDDRILIFTQHNDLVYRISRRFLIPFITHTTAKEERHDVLQGFREGRFRAIVTSKVLDEGIDVPEASLGVIVSGTGSSREFIQRLGRLLRKSEEKGEARLVELVSRETSEIRTSKRRRANRTEGEHAHNDYDVEVIELTG